MPDPAPQTVTGHVVDGAGAAVTILAADGKALPGLQGTAGADARFSLQIDGARALSEVVLQARAGGRQWLAVIPELPAQTSVLAPPHTYDIADLSPGALQLDATSTALALLVLGNLRGNGQTLASVPPCAMTTALQTVHQLVIAGQPPVIVAQMVARIEASASTQASEPVAPFQWSAPGSLLQTSFLLAAPTDYDGDGEADVTTAKFDAAMQAAAATFSATGQFDPLRIRVVISARLTSAAKDNNCNAFNPGQWADLQAAGSRMFLTGGVHKDTPRCQAGTTENCLTDAQVDAINQQMGGWVPNVIPMYDDGTHGDAVAGDATWSLQLDVPRWPVAASDPDGVGVRLGYKFTYGQPKQGWTGSEEFPGNERHLELVDMNGDGLVTRFDLFGDETGNKDKKNLLDPAHGGCGTNKWWAEKATAKGCFQSDTRERAVDLDGDCKIDGWPLTGAVAPLTLTCGATP